MGGSGRYFQATGLLSRLKVGLYGKIAVEDQRSAAHDLELTLSAKIVPISTLAIEKHAAQAALAWRAASVHTGYQRRRERPAEQ